MQKNKNYKEIFSIKLFLIIVWLALWASINSMPGELEYMNKNLLSFFNGMRTIGAIFFSILTIIFTLYLYFKKKIRTYSAILLIFFIHFFSQFIGLIFNDERIIDLNTSYLILYAISTICLLHIINNLELNKLFNFFTYLNIFILIISIFMVMEGNSGLIMKIFENNNFYNFLHPDISINNQAPPRITGFARTFAIINTFLMIIYLINKNKYYSYLLLIFIFFVSCLIWLCQSRGALLCYYSANIFLIIFCNNLQFFKRIFLLLLITIFAVTFSHYILKKTSLLIINKQLDILINEPSDVTLEKEFKIKITNKEKLEKLELSNSRIFTKKHSSGRTQLWINAINYFDKKKIFGYGPQADRFLLMDFNHKYSNNVSNAALYSLLSGGYLSFLSIILIYIYCSFLIIKFFFKEKLYNFSYNLNRNNLTFICSMVFCIFFMIRSLVENSFSVFSIDFLITILSIFIIEKKVQK